MLTARYDQLGLERGDKILDLGCGFGRHAFEAARRGRRHRSGRRSRRGRGREEHVRRDGRRGRTRRRNVHSAAVQGDALHLRSRCDVRPVICSESSSTSRRPRRHGGVGARAQAGRHDGHHGAAIWPELINWALSMSTTTCRRSYRIYRRRILTSDCARRTDRHRAPLRPRSPQSLLVAEVSRRHDERHQQVREALPPAPRLGHHEGAWPTRLAERILAPLMGKSIVVYLVKPAS